MTIRSLPEWREQVYQREAHDLRVADIKDGAKTVKYTMAYYARQYGLTGEALEFVTKSLNRRVDGLIADMVADPINGKIDPAAVQARQDELSQYATVRYPSQEGGMESVELPQQLRTIIAGRYAALEESIALSRKPDNQIFNPSSSAYIQMRVDEMGRGEISIQDRHTGSTVKYTIGDTNPSAYARTRALQGVRETLKDYEREDGPKWNRSAAESVRIVLQGIAEPKPEIESKQIPLPKSVPGFVVQTLQRLPNVAVVDCMVGQSSVTLVQQGVEAGTEHRVTLKFEDGKFSAALSGSRNPKLGLDLALTVEADPSRFNGSGNSFEERLKAIANALSSDKEFGTVGKEAGLISSLLALPGAQVKRAEGIVLAAGSEAELNLAPESIVRSIRVLDGAKLHYKGAGSTRDSIRIEDSQSEANAVVSYALKNVTLEDCIDRGVSAGYFQSTHFRRVQFLGTTQATVLGEFGSKGISLADKNCTYEGCGWRTGFWKTVGNLGGMQILALKKT